MAFVRARGVRFHVVDLGAGTGREPVVLLHGLFTGSAASWYFTAAPELARHRRVRLLDWRGHGLSERTETGYGSASMAADLAALTEDLPAFALAGHSFGAVVALRFALAHPDRVTRLAFVDPPFAGDPAMVVPAARPGRRGGVAELMGETRVLSEVGTDPGIGTAELARLGRLRLPVMCVVGSESPFLASGELVGRALPGAARHVLPGGHDLHVTARTRLAGLLAEFLGD